MTVDGISHFLASVVVRASEVQDPRTDRMALIAGDLLGRVRTNQQDGFLRWARSMGFQGPAGGNAPENSIALEVLARAQKALDSDAPNPSAIAAGLQAARRLIASNESPERDNLRYFLARLTLGAVGDDVSGALAPDHLVGDANGRVPAIPATPGSRSER